MKKKSPTISERVDVSSYEYRLTERELSERHGCKLPLFRLFTAKGIGVEPDFLSLARQLAPEIPGDLYQKMWRKAQYLDSHRDLQDFLRRHNLDLPRIFSLLYEGEHEEVESILRQLPPMAREKFFSLSPQRFQAIARFTAELKNKAWGVFRLPAGPFVQEHLGGGYPDRYIRYFPEPHPEVIGHPGCLQLLTAISAITKEVREAGQHRLMLELHHVRTTGHFRIPEGEHSDGSDVVLTALVAERSGIRGGESTVVHDDHRVLSKVLEEGHGLIIDDRKYTHGLTRFQLTDKGESSRTIIGVNAYFLPRRRDPRDTR